MSYLPGAWICAPGGQPQTQDCPEELPAGQDLLPAPPSPTKPELLLSEELALQEDETQMWAEHQTVDGTVTRGTDS